MTRRKPESDRPDMVGRQASVVGEVVYWNADKVAVRFPAGGVAYVHPDHVLLVTEIGGPIEGQETLL